MKKILALALALIMALSMGVVALADIHMDQSIVVFAGTQGDYDLPEAGETFGVQLFPGETYKFLFNVTGIGAGGVAGAADSNLTTKNLKVSAKWTKGASFIESVKLVSYNTRTSTPAYLEIITKESYTNTDLRNIVGKITIEGKGDYKNIKDEIIIAEGTIALGNELEYIWGEKKADEATPIDAYMLKNTVMYAEDGAGYVTFKDATDILTGLVKVENNEKAQVYMLDKAQTEAADEDLFDAVEEYLGEDYEGIVEWYNFCGSGFKNDVAFTYDAYAEDPHYFYQWDGEKFVDLGAKFNDDEEVEAYEFTAAAKGLIIVTDVELVLAAETTKNPDTGANDVVGVAAALAVVSLVAAGAISLKK